MKVLGIETSCDETGIAIVDDNNGLIAETLHSQVLTHAEYGGVVPELASRDHVQRILPLIRQCLRQADLSLSDIDALAYTAGPGLVGALFVGAAVGRSLAWALGKPSVAVHHMEAHLLAPFIDQGRAPQFPFLCLLVSGGHTLLVEARGIADYHVLGQSLDDAVGEAFDKTAKQLGLGYPGGPLIERLSEQAQALGIQSDSPFPRPLLAKDSLDFSFSGLKTHSLLAYQRSAQDETAKIAVAAAFQAAVVDTLFEKCRRALQRTGLKTLVIAGGVSANQALRGRLSELRADGVEVQLHALSLCTDNGAMIAFAGLQHLMAGQDDANLAISVRPRWPLTELSLH